MKELDLRKPTNDGDVRARDYLCGEIALLIVAVCVALCFFLTREKRWGAGLHSGVNGRIHCRIKAKADIRSLVGALEEYAEDHGGSYPGDLGALLLPNDEGYPYLDLERAPLDPWGHPYSYEPPEGPRSFRVSSLGEDGELGGERFDRDLDNWKLEAANWIEDDRDLAK